MPKPTFQPITSAGLKLDPVEFVPLVYQVGDIKHRLALHKDPKPYLPESRKEWFISDPASGYQVRPVHSSFKGMPVSSAGIGVRAARQSAIETLEQLVSHIGPDKFNSVVCGAITKATA